MAVGVMQRLEDLNTVLGQTNDHRHRVLVAAAKNIKVWFIKVRKIKAIYHTLNYFNLDVTQKCLIAECWIPTADIEAIQLALRHGFNENICYLCIKIVEKKTQKKFKNKATFGMKHTLLSSLSAFTLFLTLKSA